MYPVRSSPTSNGSDEYTPLINYLTNFVVVQSTTVRPSDDERIETMTKLMKKEKNTKAITQFYPDYDYSEKTKEEEENVDEEVRVASPKIKSNSNKVCSLG